MPSQRASSRVSRLTCHTGCRPTIDSAGTQARCSACCRRCARSVDKGRAGCGWAIASRTPGSWASISSASTSDSRRAALVCGPRRRHSGLPTCKVPNRYELRPPRVARHNMPRSRGAACRARAVAVGIGGGQAGAAAASAAPAGPAARASAHAQARMGGASFTSAFPAQVHAQHARILLPTQAAQDIHPQQGRSQPGQCGQAQAFGSHTAIELQVGLHAPPLHHATRRLRLHRPQRRQPQPLAPAPAVWPCWWRRCRPGTPPPAVDRCRASGSGRRLRGGSPAPALHLEARGLLRAAARPARPGTAQCQQQPDGGVLQPDGSSFTGVPRGVACRARACGVIRRDHPLVDRAEHALAVGAQHLDADGVAERMKPVFGSPCSMVSRRAFRRCTNSRAWPVGVADRAAAHDAAGAHVSRLARCAMSWPKWKLISGPASHRPTGAPFQTTAAAGARGRPTRPPSSSGVTATGLKAVAGLLCRKPKPLASSAGIRLRRLQSLTSISRRTPSSAVAGRGAHAARRR
jgi:hypothetical protein